VDNVMETRFPYLEHIYPGKAVFAQIMVQCRMFLFFLTKTRLLQWQQLPCSGFYNEADTLESSSVLILLPQTRLLCTA
jgi:hypothetical protein